MLPAPVVPEGVVDIATAHSDKAFADKPHPSGFSEAAMGHCFSSLRDSGGLRKGTLKEGSGGTPDGDSGEGLQSDSRGTPKKRPGRGSEHEKKSKNCSRMRTLERAAS